MNKSVIINGTKFVPLRHIAAGQAYINPEDLDKLLKWIDETNRSPRFISGGIIEAPTQFDSAPVLAYDKDDCPTCRRSQCFGGTICFNLGEEAYSR